MGNTGKNTIPDDALDLVSGGTLRDGWNNIARMAALSYKKVVEANGETPTIEECMRKFEEGLLHTLRESSDSGSLETDREELRNYIQEIWK